MSNSERKTKARELVQILSVWGMTQQDAKSLVKHMGAIVDNLSDAEFQELAGGATLKPPGPNPNAPTSH